MGTQGERPSRPHLGRRPQLPSILAGAARLLRPTIVFGTCTGMHTRRSRTRCPGDQQQLRPECQQIHELLIESKLASVAVAAGKSCSFGNSRFKPRQRTRSNCFRSLKVLVGATGFVPSGGPWAARCLKPVGRPRAKILSEMVGATGFEPATPCAQGRCATRLRYAPTREDPRLSHTCHQPQRQIPPRPTPRQPARIPTDAVIPRPRHRSRRRRGPEARPARAQPRPLETEDQSWALPNSTPPAEGARSCGEREAQGELSASGSRMGAQPASTSSSSNASSPW